MKIATSTQELEGRNTWTLSLYERRGYNRTAVVVANKNGPILWVLLTRGDTVYMSGAPKPRETA